MHLSSLLLAPLLTATVASAADQQIPLKDLAQGWFDKAKSYVASAVPTSIPVPEVEVPEIPNPLHAGASKVAGKKVERINVNNWERKLMPKADVEEEWMIFLTGGNKTCYGKCHDVNLAWNESVALLTALPAPASGSPRLRLGVLDCERDEVLCTAWASGVPVIYHFLVPQRKPTTGGELKTPLHVIPLNLTTTEVSDIVAIPSLSESRYLAYEEYTGIMHPLDGMIAQYGLMKPFGYFMWGLGSMPGWVMMICISFVSRQIMSRRMARTGGVPQQQAAPEPLPRVAPPSVSQPKSGGSARKRK